jgi:Tol biopolymer transport system component
MRESSGKARNLSRTVISAIRGAAGLLLLSCLCLVILTASVPAQPSQAWFAPAVRSVTLLTTHGGRVDWSPQNKIAFDRKGADGYYGVWVMNPDGSGQLCLTCDQQGAPLQNKGNPAWHPSGNYIVFQAQKPGMPPFLNHEAEPGRGVGNNLWLMTADGTRYWKIVDADMGIAASGTLHPHFSPDGKKLFWAQLLNDDGGLGVWELRIADFDVSSGVPVISNIQSFQPGPVHKFFESHCFTPDSRKVLFTAQTETGNADEYLMDLATGDFQDLTNKPDYNTADYWNEHGQISPDGSRIVWVTNRGESTRALNLWLMTADGQDPQEIVNFHQPGTPVYGTGSGLGPGDSSWSPDGKYLAVYGISDKDETKGNIYLVTFAP